MAPVLPCDHRQPQAQANQDREPSFLPPDGSGAPEGVELQPRFVLRGNPPRPAAWPAGQADSETDGGVHGRVEECGAYQGREGIWLRRLTTARTSVSPASGGARGNA